MKERIARARREYARIPKYGYMRTPKPPSDFALARAFLAEDLAALRRCKDTTDKNNLKRIQRALSGLQATVAWLATYRSAEVEDESQSDGDDGCTCPDIHACPFHGPPT